MSRRREWFGRRGGALLLAIVSAVVIGVAVLALWQAAAESRRSDALERAAARAASVADSARALGFGAVAGGAWRVLDVPGTALILASGSTARGTWRVGVGRTGWRTLLIRGTSEMASGIRGVTSRGDSRVLVPLLAPLEVPSAAVTGTVPWSLAPGAVIDLPTGPAAELVCRAGAVVVAVGVGVAPDLGSLALPLVDPDTVTDSLVGSFRLTRSAITVPLRIRGMAVVDTDLSIGADLELTGVLVVRGSVHPAGGQLDIVGALVSGDAGGGASSLGPHDRVRYDACAIRHAVEQVTRPAPGAAWFTLRPF